jgi:RNA polymerase Rpb1, domain 4
LAIALNVTSHSLCTQACIPAGTVKPFLKNSMTLMTATGAKGSTVNFSQISGLLGQQVVQHVKTISESVLPLLEHRGIERSEFPPLFFAALASLPGRTALSMLAAAQGEAPAVAGIKWPSAWLPSKDQVCYCACLLGRVVPYWFPR